MLTPRSCSVPGVGMFSFGKSKTKHASPASLHNAIHVMEGATSLGDGRAPSTLPQAGVAAPSEAFAVHNNYVALPQSEAFRIEYWQLEEAKLRRQPPEKEFARQVVIVWAEPTESGAPLPKPPHTRSARGDRGS